jgi:thimet oligopeptidase
MNSFKFLVLTSLVLLSLACGREDAADAPPAEPGVADQATRSRAIEPAEGISEVASRYSKRCDSAAETIAGLLAELEASGSDPSLASVFEPFNELTRLIDNNMYEAQLFFYVHPDADVRRIAGECDQKFQGINTRLFLSRPIFEAFAAVDVSQEDAETRYFAEKQLTLFKQNGVGQDDETRARIQALKGEIVGLENEFAANVAGDLRSITVDSVDKLAGLPDDWIEAHPPNEDGEIVITTQHPDYSPFMRYAQDESLRKRLYFEYNNRAYPANKEVLRKLVEKRNEMAQLTGFASWADNQNATKMSGNAATVREFIDKAASASEDRARGDYALYQDRLRKDVPDAQAVMPWQGSFIGNKLRQELFSLDVAELRPYFEFQRVRDGIFELTYDLFGYTVRPVEAEVWHESVSAYEMWDGEELLGSFYLDMHPRENKFNHAAMFQMDMGERGRHLPSAALVTNFPGETGKGYMEQRQVETFLHEFGHLVHWLTMNRQRWVRNTDPEWDFIEAPSQMLENWLYDVDTVQRFAINDAGEPIPADMVAKTKASQDFGQGMHVFGQMALADLSLSLHDRDPANFEIDELAEAINDRYRLFGKTDGAHGFAAFTHLSNAPYAASYYLYMWSLVIADDMFSRFQAEGLRNRETSFAYRDRVLAKGGSRPAADSVADFLGRPYNFDAFEKRLTSRD